LRAQITGGKVAGAWEEYGKRTSLVAGSRRIYGPLAGSARTAAMLSGWGEMLVDVLDLKGAFNERCRILQRAGPIPARAGRLAIAVGGEVIPERE